MGDPRQVTLDDVLGGTKALGPRDVLAKIRRRVASRDAEAHGRAGEAVVAQYCVAAAEHHIARLHQIATPTRGQNGRRRFSAKATVDFLGVLLDGSGRHVALEVKTTTGGEPLALSRVDDHQRDDLDTVLGAGGLALLAPVFGEACGAVLLRPRVYVVEWGKVCARTRVSERQLVDFGCGVDPEHFLERFLARP